MKIKLLFSVSAWMWQIKNRMLRPLGYKIGNDRKLKKLYFSIPTTDHCNLNCKGCSHFCPIDDKIKHFNKYFQQNIPVTDRDGIDIYEVKNMNEILQLLIKPIPICKYCNWNNPLYGMKWEVSKKNINEWTLSK